MRGRFGPEHERRRRETVRQYKRQAKWFGVLAQNLAAMGASEAAEGYTDLERSALRLARYHRKGYDT